MTPNMLHLNGNAFYLAQSRQQVSYFNSNLQSIRSFRRGWRRFRSGRLSIRCFRRFGSSLLGSIAMCGLASRSGCVTMPSGSSTMPSVPIFTVSFLCACRILRCSWRSRSRSGCRSSRIGFRFYCYRLNVLWHLRIDNQNMTAVQTKRVADKQSVQSDQTTDEIEFDSTDFVHVSCSS